MQYWYSVALTFIDMLTWKTPGSSRSIPVKFDLKNGLAFILCHAMIAAAGTAHASIQVITLEYGSDEAQVVDLYTAVPLPEESVPTVVMAHGGLWQGGSRTDLDTLCRNIITQSDGLIACASIDYRLSDALGGVCTGTGVDTYREQLGDFANAYATLQSVSGTYRLDPEKMYVGGHSAGAHLAHTLNLRWSEFAPSCDQPGGCPAAIGAIGLEGIYDIPAWNEYDMTRWQSSFACATRKAFGAPGASPAACIDAGLGERCWDAGSPRFLADNATRLGISPVGDALLVHSPGDDWVDIADTSNFGNALDAAFDGISVVTDDQGICASSQHNLMLLENSTADCIISFVNERALPESTGTINASYTDAWYDPQTNGQGFFITVFPQLAQVFLGWFTFDTELPASNALAMLGDPGHRWLTALGPVEGNSATLDIYLTSGGIFDTATELQQTDPPGSDGTIMLTFDGCNSGTVEYDIPSITRQGIIPIQRLADDNISRCEALQ